MNDISNKHYQHRDASNKKILWSTYHKLLARIVSGEVYYVTPAQSKNGVKGKNMILYNLSCIKRQIISFFLKHFISFPTISFYSASTSNTSLEKQGLKKPTLCTLLVVVFQSHQKQRYQDESSSLIQRNGSLFPKMYCCFLTTFLYFFGCPCFSLFPTKKKLM